MPHTTAAPNVLIVDDDLSITTLVEAHLSGAGYDVITCLDPLDALARCEGGSVAVFISDYMMPGFSGLELLEVLQQKHPLVRRILLTAAPSEPEVREALASGLVERLIEKPWSRAELLAAVSSLLASPSRLR
jgi:two-component system chemotaxis response regulator CheY